MESINWAYVFSTLFIRFGGVFIVLAILQIGIIISSKIIRKVEGAQPSKPGKK
jgi:hypothetical protein